MRVRDTGLTIGTLKPGPFNAITDVIGVAVGHAMQEPTLVADEIIAMVTSLSKAQ